MYRMDILWNSITGKSHRYGPWFYQITPFLSLKGEKQAETPVLYSGIAHCFGYVRKQIKRSGNATLNSN